MLIATISSTKVNPSAEELFFSVSLESLPTGQAGSAERLPRSGNDLFMVIYFRDHTQLNFSVVRNVECFRQLAENCYKKEHKALFRRRDAALLRLYKRFQRGENSLICHPEFSSGSSYN